MFFLFCTSSEFYRKKGSKIPGSGQISTKMHGISFASSRPGCGGGLISPPRALRYQGRGGGGKGRGDGTRSRFAASGPGGTMIRPWQRHWERCKMLLRLPHKGNWT